MSTRSKPRYSSEGPCRPSGAWGAASENAVPLVPPLPRRETLEHPDRPAVAAECVALYFAARLIGSTRYSATRH
jgi:hypothetical protein